MASGTTDIAKDRDSLDTSHRNRGSNGINGVTSVSPKPTSDYGDRRRSEPHNRLRHDHYYNNLRPFLYVPRELPFGGPIPHHLPGKHDSEQSSETHGVRLGDRTQRRHKHRRRHHGRRHHGESAENEGVSASDAVMSSRSSRSAHRDADDVGSNRVRRPSPASATQEARDNDAVESHFPFVCRKGNLTFDHVRVEKQRRQKMEESNHESLSSLAGLSIDFTRRLDTTYYNLLETVASLRSAINSFQDLSDLSSGIEGEFKDEVSNLEREHGKRVAEFNGFQEQAQQVESLEERMKSGRERVLELDERLEAVKEKINAWDRREDEWQDRVSRRLRILWGIIGSIAFAFAIFRFVVLIRPAPVSNTPDIRLNPHAGDNRSQFLQNLSSLTTSYSSVIDSLSDPDRWLRSPLASPHGDTEEVSSCSAEQGSATQTGEPSYQAGPDDPLQRVIDEL